MASPEELNEAQRAAVDATDGPLLVLAGAGAGKTRVIAHRVLSLIEKGVPPACILAITFTNKAAREMRERIGKMLCASAVGGRLSEWERPYVSTFHALSANLLRHNARAGGVPSRFIIFDRGDSVRAIKEAMHEIGVDPKQYEPRVVLGTISRAKGDAIALPEFVESADDYYRQMVARVWERYEAQLAKQRALDFDDLLLKTVRMFERNPAVLERCRRQYQYIHVDEYQDTNIVQYELARLLAGERMNICVVGDIDQTIYSWRGANLDNLLRFEKTYPGTAVVFLEQNYRSTKTILAASNQVIQKNTKRFEKNLFTENDTGEPLSIVGCRDESEEASFVAGRAASFIAHGTAPREIAVLYRANFQSRALEEAFLANDVPYQVLGTRFFERREVRDVLAFIRAARDPADTTDLARIVNVPPRGIGKVTLLKIIEGREDDMNEKTKQRVAAFRSIIAKVQDAIATKSPSEVVRIVLRTSGLEEHLSGGTDEDLERLENIRELVTLATRYDTLPAGEGIEQFLEDAALAGEQDELRDEQDAVRLMTVHAAKGLEFDYVFITGLEEGLFPHEGFDEERDEEEERRLFYVALTRARRKVFLSFASVRTIFGSRTATVPSSFIEDIDEGLLAVEDASEPAYAERIIE